MDLENINPINNHIIDEVTNTIVEPVNVVEAVKETVEETVEKTVNVVEETVEKTVNVVEETVNVVEETVEKTVNVVVEVAKETVFSTLLDLLSNVLNVKANLDNFKIPIKPEIKECLLVLMKEQPVFFDQCDISLKRIISDNKVDTKDIPEIIALVSKLYVVIKKTKKNSKKIDTYELIKTILHILFILHMQHHNIKNDELTNSIINILDASIDLLKLNSSLKSLKTPNCLKCFMS